MKLTDLAPLDKWIELEEDIHCESNCKDRGKLQNSSLMIRAFFCKVT